VPAESVRHPSGSGGAGRSDAGRFSHTSDPVGGHGEIAGTGIVVVLVVVVVVVVLVVLVLVEGVVVVELEVVVLASAVVVVCAENGESSGCSSPASMSTVDATRASRPPGASDRSTVPSRSAQAASTSNAVMANGRHIVLDRTQCATSAVFTCLRTRVAAMSRNAYHDHLRSVPLFADLDDHDLDVVGRGATELTLTAGQHLMRAGSTAREMVVVLEGELSIQSDGEELASVGPGGFAGEMGLLTDEPRSADVFSKTDVTVVHIDSRSFDAILEEAPQIAVKMLPIVAKRAVAAGAIHHTD